MNLSKICLVKQVVRAAFIAGLLLVASAGRTVESGVVEERDSLEDESRSGKPTERYADLYESIMVRQGPDGKLYGLDELDPLLWRGSTYLLEGASHERFVASFDAFAAQPAEVIEGYSTVQRAVMQRLLWAVFDWAANRGRDSTERRRRLQQQIAPVVRKLCLSGDEIRALPNNFSATVKAKRYASEPDSKSALKPFFPATLFATEGPWVCLKKFPLTAKVHGDDLRYRSVFNVFMRVPGGREPTIRYLKKLADVRDHWTTDPTRVGELPDVAGTDLILTRRTPELPVGTQFALVRQSLLISNAGELVVSPLIESVQVRAYLKLHSQAVAEFVMEPRELLAGRSVLRAVGADESGFQLFVLRVQGDPFRPGSGRSTHWDPPWREEGAHKSRLRNCTNCHSGYGIRSVAIHSGLFNESSTGGDSARFRVARPEDTWKQTLRGKRATYSWGLLQGLLLR